MWALATTLLWAALNVGLNVYNKWMFQKGDFRLPLTVVCFQQAVTFGALYLVYAVRTSTWRWRADGAVLRRVAILGVCFGVNTVANIESLAMVSLTLNQSIRAFLPVATMCASVVLEGKRFPPLIVANAVLLCGGVVLCILDNPSFDALGVVLCIVSVAASAAQNALAGALLSGESKPTPFELTLYQSGPLSLIVAVLVAVYERDALEAQTAHGVGHATLLLLVSAALAMTYNAVRFALIRSTSSVFLSVVGNAKIVALVVVDALYFGNQLRTTNIVGVSITVATFVAHAVWRKTINRPEDENEEGVPLVVPEEDEEEGQ